MFRGGEGGQLPIREMRGEDQRRLAVIAQAVEQVFIVGNDTARVRASRIVVPKAAEMHVFARDAAQFSQAPRSVSSIQVSSLPGKAARRLFRPIRWTGRKGPTRRMKVPHRSDALSGFARRSAASCRDTAFPRSARTFALSYRPDSGTAIRSGQLRSSPKRACDGG